jgi:hypothetical protein
MRVWPTVMTIGELTPARIGQRADFGIGRWCSGSSLARPRNRRALSVVHGLTGRRPWAGSSQAARGLIGDSGAAIGEMARVRALTTGYKARVRRTRLRKFRQ